MKLEMIGCSHHDVAVEVRERLALTGTSLQSALEAFRERFPSRELVVLSTCNRVELYSAENRSSTPSDAPERSGHPLVQFLAEQQDVDPTELMRTLVLRHDADAVRHLFMVASSLDSMVVGEPQILSQVKQAYDLACTHDSAGPMTHSVFQAANRTAKRVHDETGIARRRVSVPSVAVGEIIPEIFDSLAHKTVVLCGAGEMATETLRYLRDAGAGDIRVLNRSFERAVRLSSGPNDRPERWETLTDQIVEADVVIGTTASDLPILDSAAFVPIERRRRGRELLILDLAVPRDFDPAIAKADGVYLYSMDDLQTACERNRRAREKEWPKAEAIIQEETGNFMRSIRHRETGPIIQRLRQQASDVKAAELQRLMHKISAGGGATTPGDSQAHLEKEIEKSFDRLINKLLHPPLASLRDDAADDHRRGLAEALRQLFSLGDDAK